MRWVSCALPTSPTAIHALLRCGLQLLHFRTVRGCSLRATSIIDSATMLLPHVQVFFTTYMEYVKVSNEATDLAELGVEGMGSDPFEDCPACANVSRPDLCIGEKGALAARWRGVGGMGGGGSTFPGSAPLAVQMHLPSRLFQCIGRHRKHRNRHPYTNAPPLQSSPCPRAGLWPVRTP